MGPPPTDHAGRPSTQHAAPRPRDPRGPPGFRRGPPASWGPQWPARPADGLMAPEDPCWAPGPNDGPPASWEFRSDGARSARLQDWLREPAAEGPYHGIACVSRGDNDDELEERGEVDRRLYRGEKSGRW